MSQEISMLAPTCWEWVFFWKVMSWIIPLFVTVSSAFFIYMLTGLTGPMKKAEVEIQYLHEQILKLTEENDKLREKLINTEKRILMIESEIKYLYESSKTLKRGDIIIDSTSEKPK